MRIIFLGTNGWYTDEKGNTSCILIDSKDNYVIFDAGNGLYKIDKYITDTSKPISLFISHFHLDHVSGLHVLSKFDFPQGIDIYVGPNRTKDFMTLVKPPFTVGYEDSPKNIVNLKTKIRLHEVTSDLQAPFNIQAFEMFHGYTNHSYRIELEDKTISYSGDCGISASSRLLAQDADILIHECSWLEAKEHDTWGHVDATQAANLAKESNIKKLILTHFDPTKFTSLELRKLAEDKAREVFQESYAALDDQIFEI